jgi:hypothetical protein
MRVGFPIGFAGNAQENPGSQEGLNYIYNHINIKISYHSDPDQYEGRRIVGFEVEPESITHTVDFDPKDPKQVTKSVQFTAPVSLTYCAVSVDLFETRHWPTSC